MIPTRAWSPRSGGSRSSSGRHCAPLYCRSRYDTSPRRSPGFSTISADPMSTAENVDWTRSGRRSAAIRYPWPHSCLTPMGPTPATVKDDFETRSSSRRTGVPYSAWQERQRRGGAASQGGHRCPRLAAATNRREPRCEQRILLRGVAFRGFTYCDVRISGIDAQGTGRGFRAWSARSGPEKVRERRQGRCGGAEVRRRLHERTHTALTRRPARDVVRAPAPGGRDTRGHPRDRKGPTVRPEGELVVDALRVRAMSHRACSAFARCIAELAHLVGPLPGSGTH